MSCHSLLISKVSAEKSADSLTGFSLYGTSSFYLSAFKIYSLSSTFHILIKTRLDVDLFGFIFFRTL